MNLKKIKLCSMSLPFASRAKCGVGLIRTYITNHSKQHVNTLLSNLKMNLNQI